MLKKYSFNFWVIVALISGASFGFLSFPPLKHVVELISLLFVNILKLISLPMIFLAIVSTITRIDSLTEAKVLLRKVLKYTIFTTVLSASVALALFILIKPSALSDLPWQAPDGLGENYISFLLKIIPTNPLEPFLENNVLGVVFMAGLLGLSVLYLPKEHKNAVRPFFQGMFESLLKIATTVVYLLPIGVFAFTYQFVQTLLEGDAAFKNLFYYVICVVSANLIQGLIVLPLLLLRKGISPIKLAKSASPALINAFFTKSSNATLPLSLQSAEKRFGIHPKISRFTLPLCSVVNMNGCAAFILITVLFVTTSSGISLTILQMLPWILFSTLAAIGNAGVPMGCYFLTSAFLIGMNVPITLLGIILPLYTIFDMIETALNIWSDMCVTAIVDKEVREKQPLILNSSIS